VPASLPAQIRLADLVPIVQRVRPYSLVADRPLLFTIECALVAVARNIKGVIVECGVYRGGASMAMMLAQKQYLGAVAKPVFMLDSFEGLPPTTERDGAHARAFQDKEWGAELNNCAAAIEDVREWLREMGLAPGEFELIKGWFQETVPALGARLADVGISVLRLDGDWYESTKVCLDTLGPLVAPDGFVIIDDYYTFDGCARATHEYLARTDRPCRISSVPGGGGGAFFTNLPPGNRGQRNCEGG